MKISNEAKQIAREINSIVTNEDLQFLTGKIHDVRKEIARELKWHLNIGDRVIVTSKTKKEEGTIKKVNRTRAVVLINGQGWNVPFAMISLPEVA
tara:strand:- start:285 stop:569 length:285 start_codon:yes stop_codon:yes gene_type:complete